jgi:K+-sensing histidine kinase KdpD
MREWALDQGRNPALCQSSSSLVEWNDSRSHGSHGDSQDGRHLLFVVTGHTTCPQVLINLLGNSLKFTREGHVKLSAKPKDGGVEVSLTDTGPGIPESALGTIFQPFTQVDEATTQQYGGTGLGLSIVNDIMEALGSKVHVTSTLGVGTTFTFLLVRRRDGLLTAPFCLPTQSSAHPNPTTCIQHDGGRRETTL